MSALGPQDGDFEEAGAEEAEADVPGNGSHPVQAPDIKITFPKGAKKAAVEGQSELDALAALGVGGKSAFSVEVLGPETRPDMGFIPVKLATGDLSADRLIARLGGGTFRIFNRKGERIVTLVGPQKLFSPVKPGDPDYTQHWVQTPQGPQLMTLPRGTPPPPPMMAGGWGSPWGVPQQNTQTDIAKAIGEALKPIIEIVSKRDAEGAGKGAVEVEKIRLQIAQEEGKSRAAEARAKADADIAIAREDRARREAELKHQGEVEARRIQAQADAQVKSADALARAQTEMAQASVKAAELRARADESQFDKFMKWQERLAPKDGLLNEAVEVFKTLNGIAGKKSAAVEIFHELLEYGPGLVKSIGGEVRALAATLPMPPGQPGAPSIGVAPSPAAAPAQNPPGLSENVRREIAEFMSVVKTARTALKEKRDPTDTVNRLTQSKAAPVVLQFIAQSPPQALLEKAQLLKAQREDVVSAEDKAAITEIEALLAGSEGQVWFGTFYSVVKSLHGDAK